MAGDIPELLTVGEVAKALRIHPKTLYEAIRLQQIPGVVRIGRAIRISRTALNSWLAGESPTPLTKR